MTMDRAKTKGKLTLLSAGVVHHVRGRTRLKLSPQHRSAETAEQIKIALQAHPHVKSVQVNHKTGSVVVHHDHDQDADELLASFGEAIEDVAKDVFEGLISGEGVAPAAIGLSLLGHLIFKGKGNGSDSSGEKLAQTAATRSRSLKLAHSTPGRTRLKVHGSHRNADTMAQLHGKLSAMPGVHKVEVNHRTGSVLVHHEVGEEIFGVVGEIFEESGVELLEMLAEGPAGLEMAGVFIIVHVVVTQLGRISSVLFQRRDKKPGVAHHVHGRTRLRLKEEHLSAEKTEKAHAALRSIPGVQQVEINRRSKSITVHHDGDDQTLNAVAGVLKDMAEDLFESMVKGEGISLDVGLFAQLISATADSGAPAAVSPLRLLVAAAIAAYMLNRHLMRV